jgi:hypothetical protein
MHFGVALPAKGLQIYRVVRAAVFNFDDVMYLQLHRWAKAFQMVFGPEAMPAIVTTTRGKQRTQIFV